MHFALRAAVNITGARCTCNAPRRDESLYLSFLLAVTRLGDDSVVIIDIFVPVARPCPYRSADLGVGSSSNVVVIGAKSGRWIFLDRRDSAKRDERPRFIPSIRETEDENRLAQDYRENVNDIKFCNIVTLSGFITSKLLLSLIHCVSGFTWRSTSGCSRNLLLADTSCTSI